ncbi:polyphosphate polymerase domain-containing protein [Sedimentibacter saalensis]|jgi:hypothetical protein|uniref:VTC domain-containing protein n=1 Tax=Sedimentibacter saalensis TaxID=130788 RepID=A0A562JC63_9FIRM|nr:polyphosphate polymerase domain-containing protein [Sedimentibacter saalensis]TWH80730.1 VTC domain-containing protein [Sedimentibacter saalensis]
MGDKNNNVFERIEKKYLLSEEKFNLLFQKIEPYMTIDKFGLHTICNIYYDTETFDLIRNSIEKPSYKEKFRLRSYGVPGEDSMVFLEIKKKYGRTVFKRRISLSLNEAEDYLERGIKPQKDSQILREIDYFIKLYNPIKKVFIAYDRVALFGKEDESLRITFDTDIRSRTHNLDLRKGDFGMAINNFSGYLMEIKTSASLPLWLARILSELEIYPDSFSKYGSVYKQGLINERLFEQSIHEELDEQQLISKLNSSTNRRNIKCLQAS